MIRRIASKVLGEAAKVAGRALEDPRGQEAVARAVGAAQRGLERFASIQARALHVAGFAARDDHAALKKQIARIKRKARELGEQVEGAGEPGDGDGRG